MSGTGIRTNGIGKRTAAHLNLTVTMEAVIAAETERHDKFCTKGPRRRYERQNDAKRAYAGKERA